MKLNLRKARVVQQIIQDEIKRIGAEKTSISVSLYDTEVQLTLDSQLDKIIETNARVGQLMDALRFIRATTARKNAEFNIVDYLAEDVMLSAAESRLETIANLVPRPYLTSLAAEFAARKENKDAERSMFGRDNYSVEVNVVTKEVIEQARVELEQVIRRRRKIKEEMVVINVRNDFEVPEQVAQVLASLGLD